MEKTSLFYGRNILVEAISAGVRIEQVFYANDQSKKFVEELGIRSNLARLGIPSELRAESHQGVAFRAQHSFYLSGWDIKEKPYRFALLCNHIEDVQNLGSISRAAAAFGVDLIVHEERRSARMNAVGVKISAGQAFRMKFLEVSNLAPLCKKLRDADYQVVGLEPGEQSQSLYNWEPRLPLAMVVGSEGFGILKPVQGQLETSLHIPMKRGVESLNATHSVVIAMSWVFEKSLS